MQRTPHHCPCCNQPIGISSDMWGQYYLCQDCGFTAEDDDELKSPVDAAKLPSSLLLTAPIDFYRTTAPGGRLR